MSIANRVTRIPSRLKLELREPRLSELSRTVKKENLTYLSDLKLRRIQRVSAKIAANGIYGDALEFGVALGGSSIIIAKTVSPPRRFIGLDTFSMIPPPTSEYDLDDARERYDQIASGNSVGFAGEVYYGYRSDLFEYVTDKFYKFGLEVDGNHIQLHKGLFEDTWPSLHVGAISLVHIDCDWYDPVLFCLNAVAPLASPGAAIVIDDYNDYSGCKAAVDHFLQDREDFEFERGPNVILHRKQ